MWVQGWFQGGCKWVLVQLWHQKCSLIGTRGACLSSYWGCYLVYILSTVPINCSMSLFKSIFIASSTLVHLQLHLRETQKQVFAILKLFTDVYFYFIFFYMRLQILHFVQCFLYLVVYWQCYLAINHTQSFRLFSSLDSVHIKFLFYPQNLIFFNLLFYCLTLFLFVVYITTCPLLCFLFIFMGLWTSRLKIMLHLCFISTFHCLTSFLSHCSSIFVWLYLFCHSVI